MGSRYGGIKQLERIGPHGETLIDYSIHNAIQAGYSKIVLVIRKEIEAAIRQFFENKLPSHVTMDFVYQEIDAIPPSFSLPKDRSKPWGTGHAILLCKEQVHESFTMINGDDYYAQEALQSSYDFVHSTDPTRPLYLNVAYRLENTLSSHGSVSRGICNMDKDEMLIDLVEHKKIQCTEDGKIYSVEDGKTYSVGHSATGEAQGGTAGEVTGEMRTPLEPDAITSMNLMSFTPTIFEYLQQGMIAFLEKDLHDASAEFLIPAYVGSLIHEQKAKMKVVQTPAQWLGITYRDDKERVVAGIRALIESGKLPEKVFS